MSNNEKVLDLNHTLSRMEPDLSVPSVEQSLASIAISLKRLADHHEFDKGAYTSVTSAASTIASTIASAIATHSVKVHIPTRG